MGFRVCPGPLDDFFVERNRTSGQVWVGLGVYLLEIKSEVFPKAVIKSLASSMCLRECPRCLDDFFVEGNRTSGLVNAVYLLEIKSEVLPKAAINSLASSMGLRECPGPLDDFFEERNSTSGLVNAGLGGVLA
jgi:hypothetical protein